MQVYVWMYHNAMKNISSEYNTVSVLGHFVYERLYECHHTFAL